MFTRSEIARLRIPIFLAAAICLFAFNGRADVILHSAGWSVRSAGDSYAKETTWNGDGAPSAHLVDGPTWDQSSHADTAFDGVLHQASGSSDSDLASAQGTVAGQSWFDAAGLHAVGSISGNASGDSGRTGDYQVDAWGNLDLLSSFEAVFELTAPQWVDITGYLSSSSADAYTYADTHITFSTLDGVTLLDLYANPYASPCPILFSQLLGVDSYRLELATSYNYRTAREYMSCGGSYGITANLGLPAPPGLVPEPASITLLCFGVMGLIANRLRRR